MGVTGLWQVIQPCARPTNLATLNRKRMAIDASIWIYQFLKAMRDQEGNYMHNGHIVGFFRRICRLLFYGVMPVFVFDGGAPVLKRQTIQSRRKRREGRRDDAAKTAGKLLAVQMQRMADEEEERRKKRKVAMSTGTEDFLGQATETFGGQKADTVPNQSQVVYANEIGMSSHERTHNRKFRKQDPYHLPDLPGSLETMGQPEDPRIMSVEELEEYAQSFNSGEDINLYDFSKIDFEGEFFRSLPPVDRYNILNAARLRSRLRMGISKDQLDVMFPDKMEFSKFQIERVRERNRLTQRLMHEIGMTGTDLTLGVKGRIASDKDREYVLVKNEGAEGGWALGVVSKNKDLGKSHQPIDIDELEARARKSSVLDSEEEEDFEDIPIEGMNRLPKPKSRPRESASQYMAQQAAAMGASIYQLYGLVNEDDDSLFVEDTSKPQDDLSNSQNQNQSQQDDAPLTDDEDLSRAIAMSLQSQFGSRHQTETESNRGPAPNWIQTAVEEPMSLASSLVGDSVSGSMVAHLINNRANNAINSSIQKASKSSEHEDLGSSSESEINFGVALAAAAKKIKQDASSAEGCVPITAASSGPLPFEAMDWRKSVFTLAKEKGKESLSTKSWKKSNSEPSQNGKEKETTEFEIYDEDDGTAGGFITSLEQAENKSNAENIITKDKNQNEPIPLPPWILDERDITERLKESRVAEARIMAQDHAYREEQAEIKRQSELNATVQIELSDDGSDVEILDGPPVLKAEFSKLSRNVSVINNETGKFSLNDKPLVSGNQPASMVGLDIQESKNILPIEKRATTSESETTQTQQNPASSFEDDDEALEFEDVKISNPETQEFFTTNDDEEDIFAGIEPPKENLVAEYDAYSEPEDIELMAQLAAEDEAHAEFISNLNHQATQATRTRDVLDREIANLQAQKQKEQRESDEVTQAMVNDVQSLLRLFGVPYITAPMEAEAQCAELIRLNLVDGIVTDDSDTFLFGGTRVYKNMFSSNSKIVECYLATDLEQEMSLGRKELIKLAQLLGSDYTEGLPGIGPVTAVEILAEFPDENGLVRFREWWAEVQTLGHIPDADKANKFRQKFRKTHGKKLFLPVDFPSPAVEDAYLNPQVDSSSENFVWGIPDLEGIRRFLMSAVGWGPEKTDEVLVPIVRDINRRALEGTQSNITRYFTMARGNEENSGSNREIIDQGAGGEVFAPRQRIGKRSRRMASAVSRLRAGNDGDSSVVFQSFPEFSAQETVNSNAPMTTQRKRKVVGCSINTIIKSHDNGKQEENDFEREDTGSICSNSRAIDDEAETPNTSKQHSTQSRGNKRVKA